jgi:hypothetical protein
VFGYRAVVEVLEARVDRGSEPPPARDFNEEGFTRFVYADEIDVDPDWEQFIRVQPPKSTDPPGNNTAGFSTGNTFSGHNQSQLRAIWR